MAVQFKRAKRGNVRLRMAIEGPSGSGKTFTALAVATELAKVYGGPEGENGVPLFGVIDTERGSASLYSEGKPFEFEVLELESYRPRAYIEAIEAARAAGFKVLVIDSITHEWQGKDGVLAWVDQIKGDAKNQYTAWKQPSAEHQRFIDAMLTSQMHIIATMRSKVEYVLVNGAPKKAGMGAVQRDDMGYEFMVTLAMDADHRGTVTKSRNAPTLQDEMFERPGQQFAQKMIAWLASPEALDAEADATRANEARKASLAVLAEGEDRSEPHGEPRAPQRPTAAPQSTPPPARMSYGSGNGSGASSSSSNGSNGSNGASGASGEQPATEQQMSSIRKLCQALGKPEPTTTPTYNEARGIITALSGEYQAARRTS